MSDLYEAQGRANRHKHDDGHDLSGVFVAGGEMGALMRSHPWASTPLGPVSQWPQSLKTALSICLASRYPIEIWWGPEYRRFYNDAYRPILGASKHPQFLGRPGRECWPEVWNVIEPMLDSVRATGVATWSEDFLLLMDRYGYSEETYFTFSYAPLRDESGAVAGIFCACNETTQRVLSERRLRLLREITVDAKSTRTAGSALAGILATNPKDVPFNLVYVLDDTGTHAELAGFAGLAPDHAAVEQRIDLRSTKEGQWPLSEATAYFARGAQPEHRACYEVDDLEQRFGRFPEAPWPRAPQKAVILPLRRSGHEQALGFLVMGVSPMQPLSDEYFSFLEMLGERVATSLANVHAYEQERQRAEALAELDRAKTTFFNNVSHELRTPLTLILGPLEDLLGQGAGLGSQQRGELEVVYRNSLRLLRLVNTLLDFSRLEAGRMQATFAPVDLGTLTRDLASHFQSAISQGGLDFVVDCPSPRQACYVDYDMWEKIVFNLISNAFKFTEQGRIKVRLREVGDAVELMVSDTGIGIAAEDLPQLFKRFNRLATRWSRSHEGTGIGLALVEELASLHGGKVTVTSVLGQGSTFTVRIPMGAAHLPRAMLTAEPNLVHVSGLGRALVDEAMGWLPPAAGLSEDGGEAAVAANPALARWQHTQGADILLADDNADMRNYVRNLLLACGWQVRLAADGNSALAEAFLNPPELILTDIMMPGLDGFGLLRALRSDARTRSIPVIMLSARAGEEARVESMEEGADDYLVKPFSARELIARVGSQLEMVRVRKETADKERAMLLSVQRSEEQLQLVARATNDAIWDRDLTMDTMQWNESMVSLFGYDSMAIANHPDWWAARIHPQDSERITRGIAAVLRNHEAFNWSDRYLFRRSDGTYAPVFDRAHIVRDETGTPLRMIGAIQDLSALSRLAEELEINRERLALVLNSAQLGLWYCNLPFDKLEWTETVKEHFWLPPDAEVTIDLFYERIHPDDRERTRAAIDRSVAEHTRYDIEYRTVDPATGRVRWVSAIGSAYYDNEGLPVRFDGVTIDISARKAEAERFRIEKEITETLYDVSKWVSAELDLQKLVQMATDATLKLTGAQFGAFFYNVVNANGEAYTLYTLSGVPREAFSKFPMPRNTKIFAPTFEGEGIVRLDDVTKDPRYGLNAPYFGMPAGHLPVASYLAAPVISRSGQVLGGLFFGHADVGVFDERCERLVAGIAAQAAVAIDNANLFKKAQDELARRSKAEDEVRRLNAELEDRVMRRTAELAAANKELEAFSYSVSHDLRAPLRGIAGFANLLAKRYSSVLNDEAKGFINRVTDATQRMSDLIDDMLRLSRLTRQQMRYEELALSEMAASIIEALQMRTPERQVEVSIAPGVRGRGDPNLLRAVLENLLGNAWKFTEPKQGAHIEFGCHQEGAEVVYFVKDNGAGFDMEYADKLFGAFQRLHSPDEFEGTGVGLATVQRVIRRHGGHVWALGEVGTGASFYFTLGANRLESNA